MGTTRQTPSEVLPGQVRRIRRLRGWTQREFADELDRTAPEAKLTRGAVAKIESGSRGVTLDELFVLAAALNVSPTYLLTPEEDTTEVAVADGFNWAAGWVRQWLQGSTPLPPTADQDAYFSVAPARERRRHRVGLHPACLELHVLRAAVEEAVDRAHPEAADTNPRQFPQEHADYLRQEAERVSAYVRLLADEVERDAATQQTED